MYIVPTSESFKWEKYNLINPDTVKFVTYNGTVYYNKYLGLMQITLALQDNSHHGADYYIIGKFPEQLKHLIKKTVRLNDGICTSINGAATAMYLEIMENGDLRAVPAVGNPEGYRYRYNCVFNVDMFD